VCFCYEVHKSEGISAARGWEGNDELMGFSGDGLGVGGGEVGWLF
jgi:hypothetical protein